ncbi:MAG: hypothetical protein ABMB14_16780, partial [Myxococcota bacterium]
MRLTPLPWVAVLAGCIGDGKDTTFEPPMVPPNDTSTTFEPPMDPPDSGTTFEPPMSSPPDTADAADTGGETMGADSGWVAARSWVSLGSLRRLKSSALGAVRFSFFD